MRYAAALQRLRTAKASLCFFPQNAAEFWNVSTRPVSARGGYGLSLKKTAKHLKLLERLFQIPPDIPTMYNTWRKLIEVHGIMGVQVHDAKMVAAMMEHGVTHLLTYNATDFRRFPGITVLTPTDVVASPAIP